MPRVATVEDVVRLLGEGAQLVEVLPADVFNAQHIAGAVNIPLAELDRRAPAELRRDVPVVVYCADYQ